MKLKSKLALLVFQSPLVISSAMLEKAWSSLMQLSEIYAKSHDFLVAKLVFDLFINKVCYFILMRIYVGNVCISIIVHVYLSFYM